MLKSDKEKLPLLVSFSLLLAFLLLLIKTGWICEDAFITMTPIENLVHGYGIAYNPGYRLQAYTHPLWYLVQSAFYFVTLRGLNIDYTSQLYVNNMTLNILISLAAFSLLVFNGGRSRRAAVLSALALLFSKAFVEYSTSGLENPLSHLIMGTFLMYNFVINVDKPPGPREYFWMLSIAGLGVLNRYDTVLFYFPTLLVLWLRAEKKGKLVLTGLLGLSPLLVYLAFSLVYFGFTMPNTYFAKVHDGFSLSSLLTKGWQYYSVTFRLDPVSLVVLAGAIALVSLRRRKAFYPLVAGIMIYLLYVLRIGGDYMAGRFVSLAVYTAVFILARMEYSPKLFYSTAVVIVLLGVWLPSSPVTSPVNYRGEYPYDTPVMDGRINDNRGRFQGLVEGLRSGLPGNQYTGMQWMVTDDGPPYEVVVLGSAGNDRYKLGPNVYLVDRNAIADPLLARLPVARDECCWKPGHLTRIVPAGYEESIRWDENRIEDQHLHQYYDVLRTIIRGKIFSVERFAVIYRMNTGQYDYLIEQYAQTLPQTGD